MNCFNVYAILHPSSAQSLLTSWKTQKYIVIICGSWLMWFRLRIGPWILRSCERHLAERLPEYMLPHQIVSLDALPLTPNGKVDREALLASSTMVSEPTSGYTEPASEMEKTLAEIWSEVLGQDMLGVHDNFFEIGGDSILSIQIVARARRAGIEFTPAQLFKYPTIADLANAIGQQQPEQVTTEQGLITGTVPLTPIQHWFFERNGQNPAQWNQAVLLRLNQPVGMQELREAVTAVLQHHDALRTRFVEYNGQWMQEQVGMPANLPLESADLRGKPAAEQTTLLEQIATRHHQSLRLDKADLVRFVHVRYQRHSRRFVNPDASPDRRWCVLAAAA
jgi:aryl carrier-like protein